ncbi:hypothetical protein C1645_217430 [Glomus cerebriforme]|uniref:AIG1-type G domain-containing protein n=1 Tax=Glomus cerebriforme TaxID=658196 RepID=A0A397SYD6_9GLOM|nr:hypothetical protein C1645_217430 [Glomus cerebriforme]
MTKTKGQQWFNDKYSKETEVNIVGSRRLDLVGSLKVENFTNLTSINLKKLKLTGLEISNCSQLNVINLSGLIKLKSLFVSDCASLTKLDCSSIGLTELEVSNLIELDCSNTSIENLCLNLCPNIIKLNCSNNNKLINLDISNCFKLEFLDCSNSKLTRLDISNCPKSIEVINPHDLVIIQEKGIKNLLIIGRTDGGKSTLCNVLCDTKDFEESEYTAKVTKNFQRNDFTWNGTKYRVVEIGIRSVEKKGLYNKIVEGIYSMPEGISQVLFVVDERFTTEAIKKLKLFEKALFESGICDYTTIVRTKFSNFKNSKECEKDRNQLFEENETIAKIVKSCRGIVYVDNPPINILANDDDDDDDDKETIRINGIRRKTSRNKLLVHLETVCQGKYYTLDIWNELYSKIANYIESDENSPTIVEEVECKLKLKVPALVNLNFDDQEIFDGMKLILISIKI